MNKIPPEIRVVVDPESMETDPHGSVTGLLCFRFGDTFVPCKGWRDYPVGSLLMWLNALAAMLLQVDDTAEFGFMEPPSVWGKLLPRAQIALEIRHDGVRQKGTPCLIVRVTDFAQVLLAAAEEVVEVARARNWASRDTEMLAKIVERIRRCHNLPHAGSDPGPVAAAQFADASDVELPQVPTPAEIRIDMQHIMNCHTVGGPEATPGKTLFPAHMNERQIEETIRRAYSRSYPSLPFTPDGVHFFAWDTGGTEEMEIWVNAVTKTIETAEPLPPNRHDDSRTEGIRKIPVDFGVVVDTSTLRVNAGGSITGVVYFRFGETLLPGAEWRDFVVVLLTWWLKVLVKTLLGISGGFPEFRFMDDNFVVRSVTRGAGKLALVGMPYAKWPSDEERFIVDPVELMHSLLSAAEEVLEAVKARGWSLPEIDDLARIYRRVKELEHTAQ